LAVFRVIQEALNNIKNHAQAKSAVISMKFAPDLLSITIRDDGVGFKVPRRLTSLAVKWKLGLIDIQERVQLLGGKFVVKSKPNGGTLLSIEIGL
jgi:signal transduction histidine kinase